MKLRALVKVLVFTALTPIKTATTLTQDAKTIPKAMTKSVTQLTFGQQPANYICLNFNKKAPINRCFFPFFA
jgi:hypothetical protein